MKKLLGIVVLNLLLTINTVNAKIYWVYEFYKVSPQSNIFAILLHSTEVLTFFLLFSILSYMFNTCFSSIII